MDSKTFRFMISRNSVLNTTRYNILCWYTPIACEVFKIDAHSFRQALEYAKIRATEKGYRTESNKCKFVL